MFKLGARLLNGRDVRDTIPLIPISTWARQRIHAALWLMINVLQSPRPVHAPLTIPRPSAPFYGYTERTLRLTDGTEIPTMRNLIRVTGWIATARIAYPARQYVIWKRDWFRSYQETINDEWTTLLEQIDQRCRMAWHYRISDDVAQPVELHSILLQTLAFGNHFVDSYRQFLVTELTGVDTMAQGIAVQMLDRTLYADPTVKNALEHVTTDDPKIRATANRLARQIESAGETSD